jgi:serine O-acetyltransferase
MNRNRIENLKAVIAFFGVGVLFFHIIFFNFHPNKKLIKQDLKRWMEIHKIDFNIQIAFLYFMLYFPEFRNVFYKRVGIFSKFFSWICPKMNTLFIVTNNKSIGPGLYLEHGFSTIITAKSIGSNCWINQQVTIGFKNSKSPIIGDNVTISCGAKILGGIKVGNNSIVGANAVVVKDVPENAIVAGVPAIIIGNNKK